MIDTVTVILLVVIAAMCVFCRKSMIYAYTIWRERSKLPPAPGEWDE